MANRKRSHSCTSCGNVLIFEISTWSRRRPHCRKILLVGKRKEVEDEPVAPPAAVVRLLLEEDEAVEPTCDCTLESVVELGSGRVFEVL